MGSHCEYMRVEGPFSILTVSMSLQKALVHEKTILVSIMSDHFTCHPASDRQEMPYLN